MSARLKSAIPSLASLDIERSVAFFGKLGFARLASYSDYAVVERDSVQLHFWLCDDPAIPRTTGCRISVEHVAELFAEYSAHGVIHPNGALAVKPWGWREFSILDVDGNLVTFGERAA